MDNEIKAWLFDINSAITEIDGFFEEGKKIFENYIHDLKTKRAVERNLEIIGESVKRIINKNKNIELTNASSPLSSLLPFLLLTSYFFILRSFNLHPSNVLRVKINF